MEGAWLTPRPSHFTPRNDSVTVVKEAGRDPGLARMCPENLAPLRFEAYHKHSDCKMYVQYFDPLPTRCTKNLYDTYRISQPIRRTFFPKKCDLNLTCVLCAEGKKYFQTYKYPYSYYTTSLLWDSEICFQIMISGITACERLTFLLQDM
jgi:hypothetical protein